ncbi:MAG TPA: alpha/beta hydrolase [Acidimicrobiia bacterium]|nr:alpha/beta hydrolase [Acidimicrobiia bacterium]
MPTAEPAASTIAAGDIRLVLYDWGGDETPLLLAHATGFHGRIWAPVAERLVAAGRRVWSFDFRGHGDSDRSPGLDYHWDRFADDVLAVVDHLGLAGHPGLLAAGHSKGAAALLRAERERPGTFARLWCYEPVLFPSDEPLEPRDDFPLAEGARRRRAVWPSRAAALESYASRAPFDVLEPAALRAYVEHGLRDREDGTVELKCAPEDEAAVYSMGVANGVYPRLREIACPVLVACGEETDAMVPELTQMVVDRLPGGRLEVMPGLGHFGPMQDPAAVAASILAFADAPG